MKPLLSSFLRLVSLCAVLLAFSSATLAADTPPSPFAGSYYGTANVNINLSTNLGFGDTIAVAGVVSATGQLTLNFQGGTHPVSGLVDDNGRLTATISSDSVLSGRINGTILSAGGTEKIPVGLLYTIRKYTLSLTKR
jgi:spore coat protein U-like protein